MLAVKVQQLNASCLYAITIIIFLIEVKQFIQEEAEHTLSAEQENMKLEGVGAVFRNFLEKMEELDRGIEEIAKNILPRNWSPANDVLRKERGYFINESTKVQNLGAHARKIYYLYACVKVPLID